MTIDSNRLVETKQRHCRRSEGMKGKTTIECEICGLYFYGFVGETVCPECQDFIESPDNEEDE